MRPHPAAVLRLLLVLAAAFLAPLGPTLAETNPDAEIPTGKRVALVIGNGAYGELGTLPNPPNDATDIAAALRTLHFDVTLITDGDAEEMLGALRDFGEAATGADVALFYYAGHGMAMEGENYLVPVRARIKDKLSLRYGTLNLSDVRDTLEASRAPLKMVILDACRDNPLAKQLRQNSGQLGRSLDANSGLVGMDVDRAGGWYIAYATAAGAVALDGQNQRNSPFTTALLAHIGEENVDVRVMFGDVRADVVRATSNHQTPWAEDAMLGDFQFNPVAVKPVEPVVDPSIAAWRAIVDSDEPIAFEEFLGNYPESDFASAAKVRAHALRDPAAERAAWEAAQRSGAAEAYEKFLRNYPAGPYSSAAKTLLQSALGSRLLASDDPAEMEAYIARFPDSPWVPVLRQRMEAAQAAAAAPPPAAPPGPPADQTSEGSSGQPPADITVTMAAPPPDAGDSGRALTLAPPATPERPSAGTPADIIAEADLSPRSIATLEAVVSPYLIQIALKGLGYYNGELDGKFGPASKRAASAFQRDLGASATGDLRPIEIVALIGEAARKGNADSQNTYGGMFDTGAGVPRNAVTAADWYRRSAEADYGYGQRNLACAYMAGRGVERDPAEGRRWLQAARRNDVPPEDARCE
ncbi:caspase family protein [Amaricoccus solimangrovi]|nr:caspase family protein [Amaricoccus solimangrovi]